MKIIITILSLLAMPCYCHLNKTSEQTCANISATIPVLPFRIGQWLPSDQAAVDKWLKNLIKEVYGTNQINEKVDIEMPNLHPAVQDLKTLIETDSKIYMFFHQMFEQVSYSQQQPQVRNYQMMLRLINHTMTKAPEFHQTGLTGLPMNAIIFRSARTVGGYAAYLDEKVNDHFKRILKAWSLYLESEESRYVLTTSKTGWLGADAMSRMPHFKELYQCDPTKPYWGFKSWDDFFTRQLRDGVRPVDSPDDDSVICNACESSPYRIEYHVKRRSQFWIKSQNYSILFMLANDPFAEQFVGGTVYQAFLSLNLYHRWHSPVNGKIVKSYIVPGKCFSEPYMQTMDFTKLGHKAYKYQGYDTEVSTRALIFIEADNPSIGLMCFIAVGIGEVSSCEITVYDGQRVKKGQELGMFHYGGSTYCLTFRSGVKVDFDLHGQTPSLTSDPIQVNARLATVRPSTE